MQDLNETDANEALLAYLLEQMPSSLGHDPDNGNAHDQAYDHDWSSFAAYVEYPHVEYPHVEYPQVEYPHVEYPHNPAAQDEDESLKQFLQSLLLDDVPLDQALSRHTVDESVEMERLRALLLAPERQRVAQLEAELKQVREQLRDSEMLVALLSPLISQAITERVRDSRDEVAEALYPVIGKTITRAVSEAIRDLARSIDSRMRQGLNSPRQLVQELGMRLRGVDPQSANLRRLLPFQVQEILLIHRETGLLIHHLSSIDTMTDADIISGMLTAIRSYVKDSFGSNKDGSLDAISYGELRILIEEGSLVYLAVVLQGVEPGGFQSYMRQQLSEIHTMAGKQLRNFTGDPLDEQLIAPLLQPLMEGVDDSA
jgi:OOP family OmpA-OmpF porin